MWKICLIIFCARFAFFRCGIQSGCAPPEAGWMSIAGKREWSFINGEGGIHTAAKERIDPEELTISTGHMMGTRFPIGLFGFKPISEHFPHSCAKLFTLMLMYNTVYQGTDAYILLKHLKYKLKNIT